ncbi:MAG: hypothetical protein ACFFCQ_07575, partial [Promethearchaeota archaeon]
SFTEALEAISGKVAKEGYIDRWIRMVLKRLPIDHIEPIMTQNKLLIRDPQAIQRISITLASILIATPLLGVVAILENKENPLFQEDPVIQAVILVGMMTFFIMPLSIVPLVTTTFFLSKEQMWIWDRAPHGRMEFMNSKTVQSLILSIICPFLFWFASLISLSIIDYPSLEARLVVLFLAGLFSLLGGLLLVNCILLGMIVCGYYPVTEIRGSQQVRNTLMILGGLFITHFPLFVIILSIVGTILPLPPTPAFILLSLSIALSLTLFIALIFLIVYYRHTIGILDSKEYPNV